MQSSAAHSVSPEPYQFDPVTQDHLPMLAGWLARAHVQDWWEPAETELGYIRDMLAGRDSTRPFIFSENGEPLGYIQVWFIADVQTPEWIEKEPWLADLPAEAVGVDLLIADETRLSKGIGSSVLGSFVDKLSSEGFEKIIIDPDPANTRAVRAYEKAGFVPLKEYKKSQGGILLMQYKPNMCGPVQ